MGNVCGCVRSPREEQCLDPSKAPLSLEPAGPRERRGRRYFQRRRKRKSGEFQPTDSLRSQSGDSVRSASVTWAAQEAGDGDGARAEAQPGPGGTPDRGVYVGKVPVCSSEPPVIGPRGVWGRSDPRPKDRNGSRTPTEHGLHGVTKASKYVAPKENLLERRLLRLRIRRVVSFGAVEHKLRTVRGDEGVSRRYPRFFGVRRRGSTGDVSLGKTTGLPKTVWTTQVHSRENGLPDSSGDSMSQNTQGKRSSGQSDEISDVHVPGESVDMTAKERLLLWSQQMAEGYTGVRCDNFTSSWRDGRLFNAIIHKYRPDLVDMGRVSAQSSRSNLEQAFCVAEQLGVARLLDPEDVDVQSPDEKSVITYVSTLYDVFPKVPEGMEGISANDVDIKWVEYQNMVNYLSQWIKHHVAVMSDRTFPSNPAELKALYTQYLQFKENEIPIKENEKTKIKQLYKMLEAWIEFGRIHLPHGYHPNDVEKEWGKLIIGMLEREKSLRPEVDRLEMLQQIANRVQQNCVLGEDKLALARGALQADTKRLESGIQFQHEAEIAGYLLECEHILRQQVVDIQLLLDGKFYLADQLVQKVSSLRDDLLTLRGECSSVYSKGRTLTSEQTKMMISGITQSLSSGFSSNLNMGLTGGGLGGGLAGGGLGGGGLTSGLSQTCLPPSLPSMVAPSLQPAGLPAYMGGVVGAGGAVDPGALQQLKLIQIRKPLLKSSMVDSNMSEEEVNMNYVQDLLSWVEEMQVQLDRGEWGSDLPSVETHLENHKSMHRAIEEFQMSLKEAKHSEIQMTSPMKQNYSEKLGNLETHYGKLLNTSKTRQKNLESLHDLVSRATQELIWLNEKEEEEVAFDWSDRNTNISKKRDYHADLMRELDDKEGAIRSVQDRAEQLLGGNHPARLTIEAYRAAMQTQWSWILQLCGCVEQHLRENAVYFEFFSDAKDAQDYLKGLQDTIQRKYGCDRSSSLHRLEDLVQESMDEKEQLLQYRSIVAGLMGRAKSIVQLKPRSSDHPVRTSIPVRAICDYRQIEITIYKEDECVLANNSHRAKWKVISPSGNEAMVPSVCFTVPPPNKEAVELASRIEQLYQNVLALWHHSHINMKSVVSWHYLMTDIKAIRSASVSSAKTLLPGEHQLVLSNLQSHLECFLEDSDESEVFSMADRTQLEREVDACREYYEELLRSAEREEHEESVYNIFISELRTFRMRLEGYEERLLRQIRTPLDRDDLEESMRRIVDQEAMQNELDRLKEDLEALKEKCEAFVSQASASLLAPTLSSELSVLLHSMSQVYSMSSVYLEKLKSVSLVVKHSQVAESLVKLYEAKLCEEDGVCADGKTIETVMSMLKQWRSEIDEKREVFHDLEDELQKARAISDRMFKTHNERDFDLDWHKEKADQLSERWHSVHAQIESRLRDLEGIGKSLKYYRDAYGSLDEWVREMEANQRSMQENQPEDSKALAELLNQQKVLVSEIEQKHGRIEECQKYSEQYSAAVKDYELQLMTYRAMVDSQHKSPIKRRRMQSSSDAIQQEFMDLRTRYTALVTLMTQYVKFASETLKRTEEEESSSDEGEFWPSVEATRTLEGAQRMGRTEREHVSKKTSAEGRGDGRLSRWEVADGLPAQESHLVQPRTDLPLENRSQSEELRSSNFSHAPPIKAGITEAGDSPASWHTHASSPLKAPGATSSASRSETNLRMDLKPSSSKVTQVDSPVDACDSILLIIEDGDEVSFNRRSVIIPENERLKDLACCTPHAYEEGYLTALNASTQQISTNELAHTEQTCIDDVTEMLGTAASSSIAPYSSCSFNLETIDEDEREFGLLDIAQSYPIVGSVEHMNIPSTQSTLFEKTERITLVSDSLSMNPGDVRHKTPKIDQSLISGGDSGRSHHTETPLSRSVLSPSVKPNSHEQGHSPEEPPNLNVTCGDEGLDAFLSDPNVSPDAKIKQLLIKLKALESNQAKNRCPEHLQMPADQLRLGNDQQQKAIEERRTEEYITWTETWELQKSTGDEEITKLQQQVSELEGLLAEKQQQHETLEVEFQTMLTEKQQQQENLEGEFQAKLTEKQQLQEKLEGELEDERKTVEELTVHKSKLEHELKQYQVELEAALRAKASFEQELGYAQQIIQQSEAKRSALEESLMMLKRNIEESTLARRKLEDHLRRKDNDVQGLEEHKRALERELKAKEGAETKLLSQVHDLEIEFSRQGEISLSTNSQVTETQVMVSNSVQSSVSAIEVLQKEQSEVLKNKLEEMAAGRKKAEFELKTLKSELNSVLVQKNVAEEKAQRLKDLVEEGNNRLKRIQADMETERATTRQKTEELRQEVAELKRSVFVFQEQVKSLQRDKAALEQKVVFHMTEIEGLKEQLKINQGKLLQMTSIEQESNHKMRCMEDELINQQTEGDQLRFTVNELTRMNGKLDNDIKNLKVTVDSLQQEKILSEQMVKAQKSEMNSMREVLQKTKEEYALKVKSEQGILAKAKSMEVDLNNSNQLVNQLKKNMEELKNSSAETERSMKNVKMEFDKAVMEIGSKDQQISIFKSQVDSAKSQLKIIEEELLKKTQTAHELQIKLRDYDEEVKKSYELLQKNKAQSLAIATHEKDVMSLRSELSSLSVEKRKAEQNVLEQKAEINNLNLNLRKTKDELQKEVQTTHELHVKLRDYNEEVKKSTELQQKNKALNLELATQEKDIKSLKTELNTVSTEKRKLEQQVHELKTEMTSLNAAFKRTTAELQKENQTVHELQIKLRDFNEEVKKSVELQQMNKALGLTITTHEKDLRNVKTELNTVNTEKRRSEQQVLEHKAEISNLNIMLKKVKDELQQEKQTTHELQIKVRDFTEEMKKLSELQQKNKALCLEIATYEMDVKTLRSNLDSLSTEKKLVEQQMLELNITLKKTTGELQKESQTSHELQIKMRDYGEEVKKSSELQQKNKMLSLTIATHEKDIRNLKSDLNSVNAEKRKVDQQVQELKNEISILNVTLRNTKDELQKVTQTSHELQIKLRTYDEEAKKSSELQQKNTTLSLDLVSNEKDIKNLKAELNSISTEKRKVEQQLLEQKAEVNNINTMLRKTTDELQKVTQSSHEQQIKLRDYNEEIKKSTELQQKNKALELTIATHEKDIRNLKSEHSSMNVEKKKVEQQVLEQKAEINNINTELKKTKEELQIKLRDFNEETKKSTELELKNKAQDLTIATLEKDIKNLKSELNSASTEKIKLNQQVLEQKAELSNLNVMLKKTTDELQQVTQSSHELQIKVRDYNEEAKKSSELQQKNKAQDLAISDQEKDIRSLRSELNSVNAEKRKLDQQVLEQKAEISNLNVMLKKTTDELQKVTQSSHELQLKVREYSEEIKKSTELQQKNKAQYAAIASHEKDANNLRFELNSVNTEKRKLEQQVLEQKAEINNLNATLSKTKDELQIKLREYNEETKKSSELQLKNKAFSLEIGTNERNIKDLKSELNSISTEKRKVEQQVHELKTETNSLNTELRKMKDELQIKLRDLNEETKKSSELQLKNKAISVELLTHEKNIKDLKSELNSVSTEKRKVEQQVLEQKAEITNLNTTLRKTTDELQKVTQSSHELQIKVRDYTEETKKSSELQQKSKSLDLTIIKHEQDIRNLRSELNLMNTEKRKFEQQVVEQKVEISSLNAELRKAKDELQIKLREYNEETKKSSELQLKNRSFTLEIGTHEKDINNLKTELNSVSTEKRKIEQQVHELKAETNNLNIMLKKVTDELQKEKQITHELQIKVRDYNEEVKKSSELQQKNKAQDLMIATHEKDIRNLKSELNSVNTEKRKIDQQVFEQKAEINNLNATLKTTTIELQKVNQSSHELQIKLRNYNEETKKSSELQQKNKAQDLTIATHEKDIRNLLSELNSVSTEKRKIEQQVFEQKAEINNLNATLKKTTDELQKVTQSSHELQIKLRDYDEEAKKSSGLQYKSKSLDLTIIKHEEDLRNLRSELNLMNTEKRKLEQQVVEQKVEISSLNTELRKAKDELQIKLRDYNEETKKSSELQLKNRSFSLEIGTHEKDIKNLKTELNSVSTEKRKIEQQVHELKAETNKLNIMLKKVTDELQKEKQTTHELQIKLRNYNEEVKKSSELQQKNKAQDLTIATHEKDIRNLKFELNSLSTEKRKIEQQVSEQKAEISSLNVTIKKTTDELQKVTQSSQELQIKLRDYTEEAKKSSELQERNRSQDLTIVTHEKDIRNLQSELNSMNAEKKRVEQQLLEQKTEINNLNATLKKTTDELQKVTQSSHELQLKLRDYNEEARKSSGLQQKNKAQDLTISNYEKDNRNLRSELNSMTAEKRKLEQQVGEQKVEINNLNVALKKASDELQIKLREHSEETKKSSELQLKITTLSLDIVSNEKDIKNLKSELNTVSTEKRKIEQQVLQQKAEISNLNTTLTKTTSELQIVTQSSHELQIKLRDYKEEARKSTELQQKNKSQDVTIATHEKEMQNVRSELISITAEKRKVEQQVLEQKAEINNLNATLKQVTQSSHELQIKLREYNEEAKKSSELQQKNKALELTIATHEKNIKNLKTELNSMNVEKKKIEQQVVQQKVEINNLNTTIKTTTVELQKVTQSSHEVQIKLREYSEEAKKSSEVQQKNKSLDLTIANYEKDIRNLKSELSTMNTEKRKLERQVTEQKSEITNLNATLRKTKDELQVKLREHNEEIKKSSDLQQKNKAQDVTIATLERDIKNLKSEISSMNTEKKKFEQQVLEQKTEIYNLNTTLKTTTDELQKVTQFSQELQIKLRDYDEEVKKTSELQQKSSSLSISILSHENDIRNLTTELNSVSEKKKKVDKKVLEQESEISNLTIKLKKAMDELRKESADGQKHSSKVKELEAEVQKCRQTINDLSGNSEKVAVNLRQELAALQRDKKVADQELVTLKAQLNELNYVLKRTKDELQEGKKYESKVTELQKEVQRSKQSFSEVSSSSEKFTLSLKQEISGLQKERSTAQEKEKSLMSEVTLLKKKLEQTQDEVQQKQKEASAAQLKSQGLEEQVQNCKQMLEDLKGKLELQKKGYESQLELLQTEMEQKLVLQSTESSFKMELDKKSRENLYSTEVAEREKKYLQEIEQLKTLNQEALKLKKEAQQQVDTLRMKFDKGEKEKSAISHELIGTKTRIAELEKEKLKLAGSVTKTDSSRNEITKENARLKQTLVETERKLAVGERESRSFKEQVSSYIKEVKDLQEKVLKLEVALGNESKKTMEKECQMNHQCFKDNELAKLKNELLVAKQILTSQEEIQHKLEEELRRLKISSETSSVEKAQAMQELTAETLEKINACGQIEVQQTESQPQELTVKKTTQTSKITQMHSTNISQKTEHTVITSNISVTVSEEMHSGNVTSMTNSVSSQHKDTQASSTSISSVTLRDEKEAGHIAQPSVAGFIGKTAAIAGIYTESSKKKVSFMEAAEKGFIAQTYAIEFLEAQAATGQIIDYVTGKTYSVQDALDKGIVEEELRERLLDAERAVTGYAHGSKTLSVFQAMESRILDRHKGKKIIEVQIATGGLVDPQSGIRVSLDIALEKGLINKTTLQTLYDPVSHPKAFHNPDTGHKAYYGELLKTCVYDVDGQVFLLPFGSRHLTNITLARPSRLWVISSSSGTEMSTFEAYMAKLIDRDTYLLLSQQENMWEEITQTDSSGGTLHILTDLRSGRQLCIERCLVLKIITIIELENYRAGLLKINELADLLISRRSISEDPHSSIAGLWDINQMSRLSLLRGHQQNLLDRLTAIRLLEAQACTGGICDPLLGEKFTVAEALQRGLLDETMVRQVQLYEQAYRGIAHPQTGAILSVAQAMQQGLFPRDVGLKCLEFQALTGGLVQPGTLARISVEEAARCGLIDEAIAAHLTDEKSYTKNLTCPKTKRKISFKEALEKGVYDCHTGFKLLRAVKSHNVGVQSFHYIFTYPYVK